MATFAGIGISLDQDSFDAGLEAAVLSLKGIGDRKPDVLFVFASTHFDQQKIIDGVGKASKGAPLIGASAEMTMTREGIHTQSVVVMAVASDTIKFSPVLSKDVRTDARAAARSAAAHIAAREDNGRRLFFMIADVSAGDGEEMARGVGDAFGQHFPVVGAASSSGLASGTTYQYSDAVSATGAIAGLGVCGSATIGVGTEHGWVPIGLPMRVTKTLGTVLAELDGHPAIKLYEEYFGKSPEELRNGAFLPTATLYPLGFKVPGYDTEYVVRDPLGIDEAGGILLSTEIPEGTEVRLMIGSKERVLNAAKNAAEHVMQEFKTDGTTPKFALLFSSMPRQKLLGVSAHEEIRVIGNVIGADVPLAGFYAHGTWAPAGGEMRDPEGCLSHFYEQAVTVLVIGE